MSPPGDEPTTWGFDKLNVAPSDVQLPSSRRRSTASSRVPSAASDRKGTENPWNGEQPPCKIVSVASSRLGSAVGLSEETANPWDGDEPSSSRTSARPSRLPSLVRSMAESVSRDQADSPGSSVLGSMVESASGIPVPSSRSAVGTKPHPITRGSAASTYPSFLDRSTPSAASSRANSISRDSIDSFRRPSMVGSMAEAESGNAIAPPRGGWSRVRAMAMAGTFDRGPGPKSTLRGPPAQPVSQRMPSPSPLSTNKADTTSIYRTPSVASSRAPSVTPSRASSVASYRAPSVIAEIPVHDDGLPSPQIASPAPSRPTSVASNVRDTQPPRPSSRTSSIASARGRPITPIAIPTQDFLYSASPPAASQTASMAPSAISPTTNESRAKSPSIRRKPVTPMVIPTQDSLYSASLYSPRPPAASRAVSMAPSAISPAANESHAKSPSVKRCSRTESQARSPSPRRRSRTSRASSTSSSRLPGRRSPSLRLRSRTSRSPSIYSSHGSARRSSAAEPRTPSSSPRRRSRISKASTRLPGRRGSGASRARSPSPRPSSHAWSARTSGPNYPLDVPRSRSRQGFANHPYLRTALPSPSSEHPSEQHPSSPRRLSATSSRQLLCCSSRHEGCSPLSHASEAPNTGTDPRVVATSYRRKRSTTYTPPTAAELALIHPAQRDLYRENHELDFATKQSLTSLPDWSGCTTFETMCDKCKRLYGKINPHVSPLYRQCPASTTTYIVDGTYIGTKVKAIDIVEKFSAQIQLNAKRDTPVHAAVRRSAGSSYSAGNWYDVTSLPSETRHVDSSPSLLEQVFYWHWMKQQKRKDEAADAKRSKKREISILVDLHFWPDEDYDTFFLRAINEVVENIQTEVFEMHCSLHRLRWWKDTHPVAGRRRRGESEAEWRERLSRTPST